MDGEWLSWVDWMATAKLIAFLGFLCAIWWLNRKWRRVELALEGERPSGADAYLSLFIAALIFMTVTLVGAVLYAPDLSRLWQNSTAGLPEIGDLVEKYSSGLSLLFSIPTALAGSVVAIVLALRALKSADDVKALTERQTDLMQEQNRLQEEQIRLSSAQSFFEQRQIVLMEVDAIQSRFFELCDALTSYLVITRWRVFGFWEGPLSGRSSNAALSLIDERDFVSFFEARERVFESLKAIAEHPASFRLWRQLVKSAGSPMIDGLEEQARHYSLDSLPQLRLAHPLALVNSLRAYQPCNSRDEVNVFTHRRQLLDVELDYVWRASFNAAEAGALNALIGKSVFRSDGKSYPVEIEQLERTMASSWESSGTSHHRSYLIDACIDAATKLSAEDVKGLNRLLIDGLSFVPATKSELVSHVERLSRQINDVLGENRIIAKTWLDEIDEAASQGRSDLPESARERACLVASGALLSSFDGCEFHNMGVAVLADVVCALPNREELLRCLSDGMGAEFEATLRRLSETGVVSLDIQSFIPGALREAAEWLQKHPAQALTTSFCACTGSAFDSLFEAENVIRVVGAKDRKGMFRALGLNVGG